MQSTQQVPGAQSDAPITSFFRSGDCDMFAVSRSLDPLNGVEEASSILSTALDLTRNSEAQPHVALDAIGCLLEMALGLVNHAVATVVTVDEAESARELMEFLSGALDAAKLAAEQAGTQRLQAFHQGKIEGLTFAIEAVRGQR